MSIVPKLEIEKAKNNIDLLILTIEQIRKDFSLFRINIQLTGEVDPYNELIKKISSEINNLTNSGKEDILISLLYHIDISEKSIFMFRQKNPGYDLDEAVSHLIVERELLKVLIRTNYNS